MRLMPILFLGVSLAIAFGIGGLIATELNQTQDVEIDGEFEDTAESQEGEEFDPDEGGDSLLGSTVAALNTVQSMISVLIFMPSALRSLGLHPVGARFFGHLIQLVIALGLAQLIRGFEIR